MKEQGKGLWHNIRMKRKAGKPKAKPGDKGYPGPGAFDRAKEDLEKRLTTKIEGRDYKKEYAKFQSSKERIAYRAQLVKYNRDKGTYGNGDGLDASHKDGKIAGFEDASKNRGRIEKSRVKGYKEMRKENAPNTADAMKRYKAGKAGFTDKAHLKAKGKIPRSDGEKRKSDKYK
tara:strand:- start:1416 stop:1937 length:522 start_codon:yes stop_codon:yes gene_type:complete